MIVSFAIVAYNEEKSLPQLLQDLENQDYPHEKIEVLLIDSMSTDATRQIMNQFREKAKDFLRVEVLENPGKQIPCGNNVALEHYRGDAIIRMDAHASMPPEFIRKNVEVLESGEAASGGRRPNIIDGDSPWKRMILAAEQSMFGSSISSSRRSTKRMYPKSIFCGMYRREVFDRVGKYNELLPRSEDNDINQRIRQAGYRLCYSPDIVYYQHTRATLKGMLRQKYGNGYWIGKTMGINPKCFSIYHFVPLCFVLGILGTSLLWALGYPLLGKLMWGAYGLLVLFCTAVELGKKPFNPANLLLPVMFLLLHVSYGVGTLIGLIEMPFWVKKVKKSQEKS